MLVKTEKKALSQGINMKKNILRINYIFIHFLILSLSTQVHATSFFNGTCTSQGDWVSSALSQSETILSAMQELRNDPNCSGIETVIQNFEPVMTNSGGAPQTVGPLMEVRKLSREISDLRMMAKDGNASFRGQVMDVLMNRVSSEAEQKATLNGSNLSVKNAAQSFDTVSKRTAIALDTFAKGVNETLKSLPKLESCFNNRPNQGLAITSGIIRLMGAFIDGGEGVTSRFGTLVSSYVSFARNKEFAKRMSQINEKEYWASLSCLIESSAEAYCSAKDAHAILDDQKERRKEDRQADPLNPKSQLRGYHILVRELPKISHWLQTVLNGLRPQMQSQADFQESVVESMNNLIKDKLALEGTYAQELLTYKQTYANSSSTNIDSAKRAGVLKVVETLVHIMYGRSRDGAQNFFIKVRPLEKAYFFLLGMPYPEELQDPKANMPPMMFLERNLDKIPELKNPDIAILKIEDKIEEMLSEAMVYGTNYFTTWFIPDPTKVVDEALAQAPPNVFQSFKNINNYLDSVIIFYLKNRDRRVKELEQQISDLSIEVLNDKTKYGELNRAKKVYQYFKSPTVYASIIDTRKRISLVLNKFNERDNLLNKIVIPKIEIFIQDDGTINDDFFNEMLSSKECVDTPFPENEGTCNQDYTEQIMLIDRNLLEVAFDQFNAMLQRDTFLTNRFFGYIIAEYMERIQSGDEEDLYLRDLLTVTGKNIIDKLVSINRLNPNNARLDLSQAMPINFENLEAIEQLFADDLKLAICKITARIGGTNNATKLCGIYEKKQKRDCRMNGRGNRSKNCSKGSNAGILNESTFKFGSRTDLITKDDEFGYYNQLRAKYCIQALAFPSRWVEFKDLCEETQLISQFTEEAEYDEVKVNYSFDEYLNQSTTSERVCALRDYIRRNEVFWLLNSNQ